MSFAPPPLQAPRNSSLAIWSLVTGILSMICLGPLAGIPAIICGHLALGEIKRSAGKVGGGGMATAGLVLGYIGTLLGGVALLAALFIPAITGSLQKNLKVEAAVDVRTIVHAAEQYYTEYGRYPLAETAAQDVTLAEDNNRFFDILRAVDPEHAQNPRQQVFFEAKAITDEARPRSGVTSGGVLYDPWGHPYHVRLDLDGDGQVEDPLGSSPSGKISAPVIVWSLGKNGQPGGGDDVTSWER